MFWPNCVFVLVLAGRDQTLLCFAIAFGGPWVPWEALGRSRVVWEHRRGPKGKHRCVDLGHSASPGPPPSHRMKARAKSDSHPLASRV